MQLFQETKEFYEWLKSSGRGDLLKQLAKASGESGLLAKEVAESTQVGKAALNESKTSSNLLSKEASSTAKGVATEARALSPNDVGLGGLQDYGQTQQAVATDSTET